jgi:hypothetical protein
VLEKSEVIILSLDAGPSADEEVRGELMRHLRRQLIESDFEGRIEMARAESTPVGAKGDPVSLSTLAITLAPTALSGLMTILQVWLSHRQHASVTVESGDRKLTLTGTPSKEQQALVETFLSRPNADEQ